MAELVRTNDAALSSVIESLLRAGEIPYHVADGTMSVLDSLVHVVQQRILEPDERDMELGEWLRT